MKRIATYLMGFTILSLTTISCTKESHDDTAQQAQAQLPQVVNATVPAGESYVLNLGAGSSASIQKQALHYQSSEIGTALNGNTVYKYIAAKGYAGTDEVTLQQMITSLSRGNGCNYNQSEDYTTTTYKTIVIKLNVAN